MLHYNDEFETPNVKVMRYCMNSFGVNTYLLISKKTKIAAVIDPGGEVPTLIDALKSEGAKVSHILITHAHIDHVYGAEGIKQAFPEARITYHSKDQIVADSLSDMARMFGVPSCTMPAQEIDLAKDPEFSVGDIQLRSLLTPGHTPGGVCFYIPEEKLLFSGDTLFKNSVGRTDFEGGSGEELMQSLKLLQEVIPDDVQVLPGHGKYTTMGIEKKTNFYFHVDRWR